MKIINNAKETANAAKEALHGLAEAADDARNGMIIQNLMIALLAVAVSVAIGVGVTALEEARGPRA
jgi:hypothetical protein